VPAPRQQRRLAPLAAAVAALIVVAVGAVIVLTHRGGETGAATSGSRTPVPTAAPTPAPTGLQAALLDLTDFAKGSVTMATSDLPLKDVSCGVTPANEVDEKRVAFIGRGDTAGRDYFNAAASFPTEADARTYLDQVTAAAQSCPVPPRLPGAPPDPLPGEPSARVIFQGKPGPNQFTFDAVYVLKGKVVALVMASHAGTSPPPSGDAPAFAKYALRHMVAAGP
jgi:hypothetical protein